MMGEEETSSCNEADGQRIEDEAFMRLALEEARAAAREG